jgi:hypothetical protein
VLEQFDGNCVQGGAELYEEGVKLYRVFPLYVYTSAVLSHTDGRDSPASLSVLACQEKRAISKQNRDVSFVRFLFTLQGKAPTGPF